MFLRRSAVPPTPTPARTARFAWRHRLTVATAIAGTTLFVTPTTALLAQISPLVAIDDPVYADLDMIVGSGLVRTVIRGHRPYTAREIERVIREAGAAATAKPANASAMRVLARLERRFPASMTVDSIQPPFHGPNEVARSASLEVLGLESRSRAFHDEPLGNVAADINPILNRRAGQRYANGGNVVVSARTAWQFGSRLLLNVEPRVAAGGSPNGFVDASLQAASVSLAALNMTFELGRQRLVWGEGLEGGLLLSTSSRPLNMLRVQTNGLWRLPWIFRYLGPLRGTAFVADLGAGQNFPHAKVASYKLSGAITSYFELGVAVLAHEGGKGSPAASLKDRFYDIVPVLKYTLPDHTTQFSNKFAGFETRSRIPQLHNLQLYNELYVDDLDPRRWKSSLWDDAGHIAGATLADIGPDGLLTATGEFHHTGIRYYRHTPYVSGVAYNRVLLGDLLGSQGDGGYLRLRFDRGGRQQLEVNGAIERRGGDSWGTTSDLPNNAAFRFVLLTPHPSEWRHRAEVRWLLTPRPRQQLSVTGAFDRVRDAAFVKGATRNNVLAGVQWSYLAW
jgi:hypothetical protein